MRNYPISIFRRKIGQAIFFALLVLPIGLAAQTTTLRHELPLNQRHPLLVGTPSDSFPHAYTAPDGRWTGFSTDLLDAVARIMRLDLQRVQAPAIEIHRRFNAGEFDLLQTYSQTPTRDEITDFSVPFFTLQGAIFVHKKSSITNTAALNGSKFAIIGRGSIGERFLRDSGVRVDPVYVSSAEEALRLVESGSCTGTFVSQLTALSVIKRRALTNVAMLGEPVPGYDIRHCFALHKGDTELLARLNEGLAILNRTGEFQTIYNHWFGSLETSTVSKRLMLRYGGILLTVLILGLLGAATYRRTLKKMIAVQTAELSAQKNLLQTLYDNIPMAVCLLERTPDGFRIISINQQAEPWMGIPVRLAEKKLLHELTKPTEWVRELARILSAHTVERNLIREERRLLSSAKRIIFTLVPMQTSAEGNPSLCVLGEDITERRNLDDEVSQSRRLRAIGELVGGIAHEFNNLLTPITLKTGEIQLDWPNDTRLHGELQLISDSAQRAAELTRRLLTFGRKNENRVEQIFLGSIVTACFSLLKLTVDRRIVWETAIPPNLPPLYLNPTDVNQIILNLVINARDTLMEKLSLRPLDGWTPTIHVEASLLPATSMERLEPSVPSRRQILGWQRLTVRDNGMGMTNEIRERIFEPFYTTKVVGQGTGLGLATVWHLVTEISGRIEVESVAGQGSTFHVYLPLFAGTTSTDTPATAKERPPVGNSRIFLAEDEEMVATAVSAALRRAGHSLTLETNGATAWLHLQDKLDAYDLLVLDVNMPGLDGIELAQRIRATGRYRGRIMITSGRLSSDDLQQIAEAKIDRVLNKPFQITELLGAVHDCLAATNGRR
ncbi:MAG: transporter substrate-binding domain-containing protein [Verrucomicrobia bacterium]|nr:transporter substrate-binding domain-containing protein [Verrucomicrobiota bacterium]